MSVQKITAYYSWTITELVEYRSFLYRDRNAEEMYSERAELNQIIYQVEKELDKRKKTGGGHEARKRIPREEIAKAAAESWDAGEIYGIPKGVIG
jgi:hypothetical protein